MSLVELTRGPDSAELGRRSRTSASSPRLGKHTEWVGDAPGLVLGRIVCQVINEAAFALGEGVGSAEDIDIGMTLGLNYPRGILAWADEIGLDHVLGVLDALSLEQRRGALPDGPAAAAAGLVGATRARHRRGLLHLRGAMRAVTFQAPIEVRLDERPEPELQQPRRRVVAIDASGICGSDLHIYHGRVKMEPGFTIGHEFVGTVTAAGEDVTRVKVGDRVLGCFHTACGTCFFCLRGSTTSATGCGCSATASCLARCRAPRPTRRWSRWPT